MQLRTISGLLTALTLGCGGATQQATTTPSTQEPAAEPASTTTEPAVTSTPASESTGDPLQRYAHDVMAVVSRHWTIPQTIPREEASHLEARIEINVDESQLPTAARIVEGSGNAAFDQSVTHALADLVLAHETLPTPPEGLDQHGVVRLRLRGR